MTPRRAAIATSLALGLAALPLRAADPTDPPPRPPTPPTAPHPEAPARRRPPPVLALVAEPGAACRYRCVIDAHATVLRADAPAAPGLGRDRQAAAAVLAARQEVVLRIACVGVTRVERLYDVTVEAYLVAVPGPGDAPLEVDLAGPAPDAADAARADAYARHRPLLGATLRVSTSPLGLINGATGADAARVSRAAAAFAPLIDPALLAGTLGPIFGLKHDGPSPESADPWYLRVPVAAGQARTQVWETRALVSIAGDMASVTGRISAHAPGDADPPDGAPPFIRETVADAEYLWDAAAGRLARASRTLTVASAERRAGVRTTTSTTTTTRLERLPDPDPAPPSPTPPPVPPQSPAPPPP